jgi:hypothetical protein
MNMVRFLLNWLLILTAPVWVPALVVAVFMVQYVTRRMASGGCWLWDAEPKEKRLEVVK